MSYDDLDRLVGVTAGSAQGGNAVFAYDVLDNIRQLDQGTRTVRHTYNTSNRISAIKDAAGNTLSTYVQDTRGNLVQRITGTVIDTFTFDKANRLRSASIGGVASSYSYDGLGRRVRMQDGTAITHFFYGQGGQLLYTSEGATTLRYNHIHLAGSLVAKRILPAAGGTASIRFQHTDALGSPVAETSETGAVLQRERMTAYGEPADGTWQAGPGFTGHQMDASSKLVYMQQRYYDPVSGRFLSTDPIGTDGNSGAYFGRYQYAMNNPYRFVDPDGREDQEPKKRDKRSICTSQICDTVVIPQSAQRKTLSGVPGDADRRTKEAVEAANEAIASARTRVEMSGDQKLINTWNATKWKWDPANEVFVNKPEIAAFRSSILNSTIIVGLRLSEFGDTTQKFTYQGATFTGGPTAMLFVALHELGHVWFKGAARPGSDASENLANRFAFGRLHRNQQREVSCATCQ